MTRVLCGGRHQDAWFNRSKKTGANGNWQRLSARAPGQRPPGQGERGSAPLPALSPRTQAIINKRREAVLSSGQVTLNLPLSMRLPALYGGREKPSDLW